MAIDTLALARTMQRIAAAIDAHCRPATAVRRIYDAAPFGSAYVCISPGEESQFASPNHNRIHLRGTDGGLTREGLAQLCGLFAAAGVGRFFVWLTPGPDMEVVRGWLAESGMARNPHVAYPTLARPAGAAEHVPSDIEVRELAAEDVARTLASIDGASFPDFRRLVGAPGFFHYVAHDGGRPIGSAALQVHDDVGHLCMAFTAEADRRRGAQQALIARRIEAARALGCRTLVSETLSFLKSSLGNLRRAGFAPVYDKEVYNSRPES
jgi:GNAT superfamily N-acetyltransferase